jgi:penicillin amidase
MNETAAVAARPRRSRRWLRLVLLVLALAVVGAGVFLTLLARSGRPQRSGDATLAGLTAPVTVRFDRWGTPSVWAQSGADLAEALGWLHANDRMFQMELGRRSIAGRLSEVFGRRALEFDSTTRQLGFRRRAEALAESASPETRAWLDAYARGVNAWIEARRDDLPPELELLGVEPEPWTPADSIGFIFYMARSLSPVDEPEELEAFRLLGAFGTDTARALVGRPGAQVSEEIATLARDLGSVRRPLGERAEGADLGSNNWAVSPERTANRHALVANDPHLGLGLPPLWFSARLHSPDYDASGVTIPGTPAVVLGRGPHVAWAFTNLYVDDLDVFVEQPDDSGTKVRRGDGWAELTVVREIVRVKGEADVVVLARSSDRGPVLAADPANGLPARSLTWTGSYPADQLAAFLALARARSVRDLPAAIEPFVFPAQNLVAADAAGSIAWMPIGRAPRREGGDGRFPAPAWRSEIRWNGLHEAAENPLLVDPPGGAVATANSFLPVEQPAWFEGVFDTPYRADRARELLRGKTDWSLDSLARMQVDDTSLWARELVRHLSASLPAEFSKGSGDANRALALLVPWTGAMAHADAGPAALFVLVERELQRAVFEDEANRSGVPRFGTRGRLHRLFAGELSADFFDDVTTREIETRGGVVERALGSAWQEAKRRFGDDPAAWSYPRIHRLTFNHPLGSIPLIGRFLDRGPFEVEGSQTTLLAFGGPWRGQGPPSTDEIDVTYGPSMRLLQDAADPDASLLVQPTGQSGHPFDPHYDDQLPLFLDGRTRSLPWSDDRVDAAAVSRLTLRPPG